MACSKSDVFDMVKEYGLTNSRPCPKRDVVAKYGDDGLKFLKELVESGQLHVRRGRNGGYFFKSEEATVTDAPVEAENAPASPAVEESDEDDLALQFAALEARLAAAEAAEAAEAAADGDSIPF